VSQPASQPASQPVTCVLLPGLASDHTLWRDQMPMLARRSTVHVTDAHSRHATLQDMASAVLADTDGPLVLIGTSMGGILALHAWRQAPQRVRGLALLGSTARADTPQMQQLRSDAAALFEQGRMDEVLRGNIPFAFHPSRSTDRALVADYLAMVRRAGPVQLARQNRAMAARPDFRPLLPAIACPLLVACGEDDLLTPMACSEEIAAAVPGARLERLPTCGHLLTLEQPERINALLGQWLDQIGV
jgi:pimeloyl-ACP methyl ester carboxylesterase